MESYQIYISLAFIALLGVLSFFVIKPLLLALFFGALLAYIFYYPYQKIKLYLKSDVISSLIICLLVLAIIIVPGVLLVNSLVKESYVLFVLGKQKLATGLFSNCSNNFCQALEKWGQNPEVYFQIQEILKSVTNWIINKGSNLLISIPKFLLNVFVIFFTMFYFLKDGHVLLEKVGKVMSVREKKFSYLIKRLKEIVHGVIYGYLIVALIQGAAGAIGFYIFGLSSPIFWGLMMAFFALVPYVGTTVIWFPASAILFLDGVFQNSTWMMVKGLLLFLYGTFIISGLDNVLKPKMIGDKAKIHPAVTMLGVIGGFLVYGPIGVLVGPLILSMMLVFINVYVYERDVLRI